MIDPDVGGCYVSSGSVKGELDAEHLIFLSMYKILLRLSKYERDKIHTISWQDPPDRSPADKSIDALIYQGRVCLILSDKFDVWHRSESGSLEGREARIVFDDRMYGTGWSVTETELLEPELANDVILYFFKNDGAVSDEITWYTSDLPEPEAQTST